MLLSCTNPGFTKSIDVDKFYIYLDFAIKEERNLDYFCFFCRSIWSSTGVHCMTCGKCVEGFDHHCSFINNCIGYKNHHWFLCFLISTFAYAVTSISASAWFVYVNINICHTLKEGDNFCGDGIIHIFYESSMVIFIILGFLQLVPIVW